MDPLSIGVLITYCGERELLSECLESLRQQTRPVDEILIYDDCSQAPAEHYVPSGLTARVIRGGMNRGPAYGRNQLLKACTSAYVHFHDADDLFSPHWHARVRAALGASGADVVFTEIAAVRDDGTYSPKILALDDLAAGGDLISFCIQGVMLVPSGTYRRGAVLAIGGYRTSLRQAEDFDFHVRFAANRPRYVTITDPLITIRVRPGGRSRDRVQTSSSLVEAVANLSHELPRKYRSDLSDAAARAGSTLFTLGAQRQARVAFRLAENLGPPRFTKERPLYKALVRIIGLEAAERLARVYRAIVPARLRALIGAR